jgi:hypothetical protein
VTGLFVTRNSVELREATLVVGAGVSARGGAGCFHLLSDAGLLLVIFVFLVAAAIFICIIVAV